MHECESKYVIARCTQTFWGRLINPTTEHTSECYLHLPHLAQNSTRKTMFGRLKRWAESCAVWPWFSFSIRLYFKIEDRVGKVNTAVFSPPLRENEDAIQNGRRLSCSFSVQSEPKEYATVSRHRELRSALRSHCNISLPLIVWMRDTVPPHHSLHTSYCQSFIIPQETAPLKQTTTTLLLWAHRTLWICLSQESKWHYKVIVLSWVAYYVQ